MEKTARVCFGSVTWWACGSFDALSLISHTCVTYLYSSSSLYTITTLSRTYSGASVYRAQAKITFGINPSPDIFRSTILTCSQTQQVSIRLRLSRAAGDARNIMMFKFSSFTHPAAFIRSSLHCIQIQLLIRSCILWESWPWLWQHSVVLYWLSCSNTQ